MSPDPCYRAGISLRPTRTYGWDVYLDSQPVGWIFQTGDGIWIADRSNGEYLAPDFTRRQDAVKALVRASRE